MKLCEKQHVILGPPGTGKTTTLLNLVVQKLESGIAPEKIAYFSFTKKAVGEAMTRAAEQFGASRTSMPHFRTIHSEVFTINEHTKNQVMGKAHYDEIGKALGIQFDGSRIDETTGMPLGNAEGDLHLFLDNLARSRGITLRQQWNESALQDLDFRSLERTVNAVTKYRDSTGLVDFTSMLEQYCQHGSPINVDVAFIDEAQDLSLLQWQTLWLMLGDCPEVYIAGDDDQAIYRWSGADVGTFLSLDGERRVLGTSWRCPRKVKILCDRIAGRIGTRFAKEWQHTGEEGRVFNVNNLDQFDPGILEGTTMMLARNLFILKEYTDRLKVLGLPYVTQYGSNSIKPTHARAIVSWGRLNKGEEITGQEAKVVYDHLRVGVGVKRGFKTLPHLDNQARVTIEDLKQNYGLLAQGHWFDALDAITGNEISYYRSVLRKGFKLTDTPRIAVNSIHGVKGGEADNVLICPDMSKKTFEGYSKNPDDEHRVAYVAVSRTKKNLFLLSPDDINTYKYL